MLCVALDEYPVMPSINGSITTGATPASGDGALVKTACAALPTASSMGRIGGGGVGGGGEAAGGAGGGGGAAGCALLALGAVPGCGVCSTTAFGATQPAASAPSAITASTSRHRLLTAFPDIGSFLVIERFSDLCAFQNGLAACTPRLLGGRRNRILGRGHHCRRRYRACLQRDVLRRCRGLHAIGRKACEFALRVLVQIVLKVGHIPAVLDRFPIRQFDLLGIDARSRQGTRGNAGVKIEIALDGSLGPWLLPAMRIGLDPGDHLLEHLLERYARFGDSLHQLASKHAVGARGSVLGALTGRRRIGYEGATGCVHPGETALDAARLGQRIVAAGIENHDVHLVLRRLHRPQHPPGIEGIGFQIGFGLNIGIDRDQVIRALCLYPMAGVIKQTHRMLVASDLRGELINSVIEIQPPGVELDDRLEARCLQCALHCGGVVDRIGQFQIRVGIVAIADDQGDARLSGRGLHGREEHRHRDELERKSHWLFCAVANHMGVERQCGGKMAVRQLPGAPRPIATEPTLYYDFPATACPVWRRDRGPSIDGYMQLSYRTTRRRTDTDCNRFRRAPAALFAVTLLAVLAPAQAKRIALVIGNDAYQHADPLGNARADARAVADALKATNFKVTLKQDVTLQAMKEALRSFKSEVAGGDEVVFYYAGHGVQLDGNNYMVPVDTAGDSADQLKDDSVSLQRVLDDMQDQKARFTLAIIDACRDNPFKGNGRALRTRGLAPVTAADGQAVLYSAGAGQEALDNLGPRDKDPNGVFTRVLIKEIRTPGLSFDQVIHDVRDQVVQLAKSVDHVQTPGYYSQYTGDFFFTAAAPGQAA